MDPDIETMNGLGTKLIADMNSDAMYAFLRRGRHPVRQSRGRIDRHALGGFGETIGKNRSIART